MVSPNVRRVTVSTLWRAVASAHAHHLGGQQACTLSDLARMVSASPMCFPLPPSSSPSLHGEPGAAHTRNPQPRQAALCPWGAHVHRPWGLRHTGSLGFLTYGRTLPPPCSQGFRQTLAPVLKVATQPWSAHASTTVSSHPSQRHTPWTSG